MTKIVVCKSKKETIEVINNLKDSYVCQKTRHNDCDGILLIISQHATI